MKKISIVIADDHLLFADGMSNILEGREDLEVTGIVANGEELLALLSKKQVDVVLLDISMPGTNGLEAARKMKLQYPGVSILVITMNDSLETIKALLESGVRGILPKNTGKSELLLALEQVAKGEEYFSHKITRLLAKGAENNLQDKWQLTKREKEVLHHIHDGLSTSEIAEKLFISVYTVETHKKNLFLKSGVNKSSLLVKQAMELGYLKPGI